MALRSPHGTYQFYLLCFSLINLEYSRLFEQRSMHALVFLARLECEIVSIRSWPCLFSLDLHKIDLLLEANTHIVWSDRRQTGRMKCILIELFLLFSCAIKLRSSRAAIACYGRQTQHRKSIRIVIGIGWSWRHNGIPQRERGWSRPNGNRHRDTVNWSDAWAYVNHLICFGNGSPFGLQTIIGVIGR